MITYNPTKNVVIEPGAYPCVIQDVELGTRPDYKDQTKEVPCINIRFRLITVENEEGEQHCITLRTGLNFGPSEATATKFVNWIFRRKLSDDECTRFDLEKLIGTQGTLLLSLDIGKDGSTQVNKVIGFTLEPGIDPVKNFIVPKGNK
jgi:hypothetical protein